MSTRSPSQSGIFHVSQFTSSARSSREPAPSYDTEDALRVGLIANCPVAWQTFATKFDNLIDRCIVRVTHRFHQLVSSDDVREIRATLYLSLLSNDRIKLRTYNPDMGTRFSSWIGMLAVHCAYDYLRILRREPNRDLLDDALSVSSQEPSPFDQVLRREQTAKTTQILSEFTDRDRDFFLLYFREGLEPETIADRMNISTKTVYTKKHKIQNKLMSLLSDEDTAA
jgi:RNA polymerase sigma-70 factor (ECF subfamily)